MKKALVLLVVLILAGCTIKPFYATEDRLSLLAIESNAVNFEFMRFERPHENP